MKTKKVREIHYLIHEDLGELKIPMSVDAEYKQLDDGFTTVDYDPDSIDYPTEGNA